MTVGTSTYMGLAMPLLGEAEMVQSALATDILTITGATSQSGDFLVCRVVGGTEKFSVDVSGNVIAAGTLAATGAITGAYFINTLQGGTAALTTANLPTAGAFGFAVVSTTSRIYIRQGTTVTYFSADG
jgi:ABC-type arginine transport system permease subunit